MTDKQRQFKRQANKVRTLASHCETLRAELKNSPIFPGYVVLGKIETAYYRLLEAAEELEAQKEKA